MKIKDYLSKGEIIHFTDKSDFHGWRLLINNWLAIIAIFAVVATYTNPLTLLLHFLCWEDGNWAWRC